MTDDDDKPQVTGNTAALTKLEQQVLHEVQIGKVPKDPDAIKRRMRELAHLEDAKEQR